MTELTASSQSQMPASNDKVTPQTTPLEPTPEAIAHEQPSSVVDNERMSHVEEAGQDRVATPPQETKKEVKVETLSEEQLHTLFAGAPQFLGILSPARSILRIQCP
jgi:hypothetical protein